MKAREAEEAALLAPDKKKLLKFADNILMLDGIVAIGLKSEAAKLIYIHASDLLDQAIDYIQDESKNL